MDNPLGREVLMGKSLIHGPFSSTPCLITGGYYSNIPFFAHHLTFLSPICPGSHGLGSRYRRWHHNEWGVWVYTRSTLDVAATTRFVFEAKTYGHVKQPVLVLCVWYDACAHAIVLYVYSTHMHVHMSVDVHILCENLIMCMIVYAYMHFSCTYSLILVY